MALLPLSSCLKGEAETYEEWREQNNAYLAAIDTKEYELVVPDWAPQNSVYIKWHNDRSLHCRQPCADVEFHRGAEI